MFPYLILDCQTIWLICDFKDPFIWCDNKHLSFVQVQASTTFCQWQCNNNQTSFLYISTGFYYFVPVTKKTTLGRNKLKSGSINQLNWIAQQFYPNLYLILSSSTHYFSLLHYHRSYTSMVIALNEFFYKAN